MLLGGTDESTHRLGCYFAPDTTFSWRFPNAVLVILALMLLAGTFFSEFHNLYLAGICLTFHLVPESPRWLVSQNRGEQALQILSKLHHDRNDAGDQFAHRELALIQRQHQIDAANTSRDGKWALFTVKTYRKRLILACMIMAAGQDVGALVINNYSVLLYARLGVSNTMALVLGALFVTVGMCAGFVTAYISDKIGRRYAIGKLQITHETYHLTGNSWWSCRHYFCFRNSDGPHWKVYQRAK